LTLLSTLQRDSRLVDLVTESLDNYTDEQIGGAARNVLRDARKSLDKLFGLRKLADQSEGDTIQIPDGGSPLRWRILGSADAKRGTLTHSGWVATHCDLPQWTGSREDALVIAPAEIEA
jgi:hypothetical protein